MRKAQSMDIFTVLGLVSLFLWILDSFNDVFFVRNPAYLLWYSSLGFLLTGIALLSRNSFLISAVFCGYFVIESIWGIGFFLRLLFGITIPGVAEYMFDPKFSKKDFILSLYHLLIPLFLYIAVVRTHYLHKYAWIGASIFVIVLATISYISVPQSENVNCVHTITYCRTFFSFLENMQSPYKLSLGILLLVTVVFIPTQVIFTKLFKMQRKIELFGALKRLRIRTLT